MQLFAGPGQEAERPTRNSYDMKTDRKSASAGILQTLNSLINEGRSPRFICNICSSLTAGYSGVGSIMYHVCTKVY